MELNSTTFILEIINFLVLVWILKRFFYQPVLDVISRRKVSIDESVAKAEQLRRNAENLQQQYDSRLAGWEQERQTAQRKLAHEIQQQRLRQLDALQNELQVEREKEHVLIQRKLETERQQIVEAAMVQSAQFASTLLANLAGPEQERKIVKLLLDEINSLSSQQRDRLRSANGSVIEKVAVTSAYPLDQVTRLAIEQACREALDVSGRFHYQEDPNIIAGLRINLGSWVLALNLQDELKSFTTFKT